MSFDLYFTLGKVLFLIMLPFFSIFLIFALFFLFFLFSSFFTVHQQSVYIVERFGRFKKIAQTGLNIKIPFIDAIVGKVSLRILQLDVDIETKTLDDVFVKILASVQYQVLDHKIYESFYTLDDPERQIEAFVFDVIRAKVPKMKLDDVFSKKDDIANSVREELCDTMADFGYRIVKALVTDINPDGRVKAAMNEINEAQRLRIAAMEKGEAEKILKVKQAEAEAESKILQGKGVAGQRKAIVDGLKESFDDFQKNIPHFNTHDVMHLILLTQYFDTLKDIGHHSGNNAIFLPHSPSQFYDLSNHIREAIITGGQINKTMAKDTSF